MTALYEILFLVVLAINILITLRIFFTARRKKVLKNAILGAVLGIALGVGIVIGGLVIVLILNVILHRVIEIPIDIGLVIVMAVATGAIPLMARALAKNRV